MGWDWFLWQPNFSLCFHIQRIQNLLSRNNEGYERRFGLHFNAWTLNPSRICTMVGSRRTHSVPRFIWVTWEIAKRCYCIWGQNMASLGICHTRKIPGHFGRWYEDIFRYLWNGLLRTRGHSLTKGYLKPWRVTRSYEGLLFSIHSGFYFCLPPYPGLCVLKKDFRYKKLKWLLHPMPS